MYFSTVPIPRINITAPVTQRVGQSLVLSCSAIAVRGITSQVDIVWSSNGSELKTVEADVTSITNNSVKYTGYYSIEQLNETDDGRVFQCTVVIDASPPVMADDNITLHTTSKNSYSMHLCISIPYCIPLFVHFICYVKQLRPCHVAT